MDVQTTGRLHSNPCSSQDSSPKYKANYRHQVIGRSRCLLLQSPLISYPRPSFPTQEGAERAQVTKTGTCALFRHILPPTHKHRRWLLKILNHVGTTRPHIPPSDAARLNPSFLPWIRIRQPPTKTTRTRPPPSPPPPSLVYFPPPPLPPPSPNQPITRLFFRGAASRGPQPGT